MVDIERNETLRKKVLYLLPTKTKAAEEIGTERIKWSSWLNSGVNYGNNVLDKIEKWIDGRKPEQGFPEPPKE